MRLASNLRKLMKQKELTTKQLAEEVGIAEGTIKTWLAGSAPRSLIDVRRVAQFLQVTFEFLVFGDETSLSARESQNSKTYQVLLRLRIDAVEQNNSELFVCNIVPEKGDAT